MRKRKYLFCLCSAALCAALITVCSYISIPVGNMKFTLQLFAVLFTAGLLPPLWATGAVCVYILLGIAGVPVFAGFGAGIGIITGPTGGYILGFLPLTLCAALLLKLRRKKTFLTALWIFLLSLIPCYICGVIGTSLYLPDKSLGTVLVTTLLPYIPFDILKVLAAAFIVCRLDPHYQKYLQDEA